MQRVWLRVALAAGAGLGSLAVCSGAAAAIVLLFFYATDTVIFGSSSVSPSENTTFYVGVVIATMIAGASLSLPPLALGARRGRALITTLLSGLCFCAFVFVSFLSLATASFLVPLISLMALVGTPVVGSLVALREEDQLAAPTILATLITALAIYCASLFAYWIVTDAFGFTIDYWSSLFAGMVVAASSWVALPGIVAMLRSG